MALPALTQRNALTAALAILRDMADPHPCDVHDHGRCARHGWSPGGHDACPQLRLRLLLQELEKQAPVPPYTQFSLKTLLRGCTPRQEVHVRVQVNGYAHRGVLSLSGGDAPAARPFRVHLLHGECVDQVSADDIFEADVCSRSLRGVPLDPTHDPK